MNEIVGSGLGRNDVSKVRIKGSFGIVVVLEFQFLRSRIVFDNYLVFSKWLWEWMFFED